MGDAVWIISAAKRHGPDTLSRPAADEGKQI
jgi:hypothetical protein